MVTPSSSPAPSKTSPVVVGLTGGVASGKSTVASRIRARGLFVVDADRLAREVVAPGSEGLAAVVEAFGQMILNADQELDRARLGGIVFADEAARQRLMAILHPRIAAAGAERIQALGRIGERLVVYDAALLVENGLADAFRPLMVVACRRELQLDRLMKRDGLSVDDAEARLRSQADMATKVAAADHVIRNDGSLSELRQATDRTLEAVFAAVGLPADTLAVPVPVPFAVTGEA